MFVNIVRLGLYTPFRCSSRSSVSENMCVAVFTTIGQDVPLLKPIVEQHWDLRLHIVAQQWDLGIT
jgi:hypothetical protein